MTNCSQIGEKIFKYFSENKKLSDFYLGEHKLLFSKELIEFCFYLCKAFGYSTRRFVVQCFCNFRIGFAVQRI